MSDKPTEKSQKRAGPKTYIKAMIESIKTQLRPGQQIIRNAGTYFVTASAAQILVDILTSFNAGVDTSNWTTELTINILTRSLINAFQVSCAAEAIEAFNTKKFAPCLFTSSQPLSLFNMCCAFSAFNSIFMSPIADFSPKNHRISFANYSDYALQTSVRTFGFLAGYTQTKKFVDTQSHVGGPFGRHLISYVVGKTCENVLVAPHKKLFYNQPFSRQLPMFIGKLPSYINKGALLFAFEPLRRKLLPLPGS